MVARGIMCWRLLKSRLPTWLQLIPYTSGAFCSEQSLDGNGYGRGGKLGWTPRKYSSEDSQDGGNLRKEYDPNEMEFQVRRDFTDPQKIFGLNLELALPATATDDC